MFRVYHYCVCVVFKIRILFDLFAVISLKEIMVRLDKNWFSTTLYSWVTQGTVM